MPSTNYSELRRARNAIMDLTCRLAQVNPTTGDITGNTELITREIDRGAADEVDLVVFPEMAITGYCVLDLVEDDAFIDANLAALDWIRRRTGEMAAVVGFIDQDERGTYNAAAVLQHGELQGVARKVLLPNYRYFDDERYFESGGPVAPITVQFGEQSVRLGVAVCEDMWDDGAERKPVQELARAGADLLVSVNASPFEAGKRRQRHDLIQRHIADTNLPFLYVNTVGVADVGRNVVVFDGDSLAYGADGRLLAKGEQFADDRVTVVVDWTAEPAAGASHPIESDRREKELYEALVAALRDYVRKTGFEKVIEPISGGIDSSLGLAICVEALGPENVVAYNLPSVVNSEATKDLAATVAANFGVDYHVVPVQSIYDEILSVYESHLGAVRTAIARENVYARVRGLLMMLASNDSRADAPAMLVSNGNETEMALGYATLYGDMSGGLGLLGDLSKMDVYDLAAYVNERYGKEMIPSAVFDLAPSAELSTGQVDPFDYRTVAPIVTDVLEERRSPSELIVQFEAETLDPDRYREDDRGRSVYERYSVDEFATVVYDTYRKLAESTFKRAQAPPVVAVSARAFGTDFREPIINGWDGRPLD